MSSGFKIIKKTAAAFAVVYAIGINTYAVEVTLMRDIEKNTVTGTVSIGTETEYEPVLIRTVNEEGTAVYLNQIYTDSAGKAVFQYVHSCDNAGTGLMTVYAKHSDAEAYDTYKQGSEAEITGVLGTVKTECAKSEPDISVLENTYIPNADILGLDLSVYNTAADENGSCNAVFSCIASEPSNKTDINNITDVIKAFYRGTAVARINKTKSAEDVKTLISDEKYTDAFGLDLVPENEKGISFFESMPDEIKEKVYQKLAASNSADASELAENLSMFTLTGKLHYGSWQEVNGLLTAYNNVGLTNFDFTVYNGLKNKDAVDKAMINAEYADYKAVEQVFSSAAAKQKEKEESKNNNTSTKPSGGSGGGGGGGGITVTLPSSATASSNNAAAASTNSVLSGKTIFNDMEQAKWAIEAVEALYNKGIINGVSETEFEPNRSITRAEFVKILVGLTGITPDGNADMFTDVTENDWYNSYAAAGYRAGIVQGDDKACFNGQNIINREEMAVMIHRVMEILEIIPDNAAVLGFDDDALISDWARESVNYLKGCSIVNGRSKNFYEPKAELTRAEAAAVVYKVMEVK